MKRAAQVDNLIIRDGADQERRFSSAMAPGYFNVDESSFESLVSQAESFSPCVGYTNFEDEIKEHWRPMFTSDEAVIFAAMSGIGLDRIKTRFVHLLDHGDLGGLIQFNYSLLLKMNHWYISLSEINNSLARKGLRRLSHLIETELAHELTALKPLSRRFNTLLTFSVFHEFWQPEGQTQPEGHTQPKGHHGIAKSQSQAFEILENGFYTILSAIGQVSNHGRFLLEKSLKSREHAPAPGLFLAFIQLYGKVRDIQNQFTLRHLDFYYNQVLGYRARESVSDYTYLNFIKAQKADPVLIPEGTGFKAPVQAEGIPKTYRAVHDLLVTDTRVKDLRTLLFRQDPLSSPESDLGMVTGIARTKIPVRAGADMGPDAKGYPIFGVSPQGEDSMGEEKAEVGLALSSPLLLLKEGQRRVSLKLTLAGIGRNQDETPLFCNFLNQASTLSGTSCEGTFFKVFSRAFSVFLTSDQGWFEVPNYVPSIFMVDQGIEPEDFMISFELDSGCPPIVPWSQDIHGKRYGVDFPVMEILINPEAYAYPLSILDDYLIEGLEIEARVTGLKDLVLYNHLGRLDPNSPFQPFGPMPEKESYLIAGSFEAAVKELTQFNLDLEWGGLPGIKNGFGAHYKGYEPGLSNGVFRVKASVLSDGVWHPEPGLQPSLSLFQETGKKRLAPSIRLSANGLPLSGSGNPGLTADGYEFNIHSRSGFFKFRLDEPAQGFGHREYPFLLTRILTENAKANRLKKIQDLPNPPYTPLVNGATASYNARAVFRPGRLTSNTLESGETLFHIHPFGFKKIFPLPDQPLCRLLPQEHRQGYGSLYMGLSNPIPGSRLTLFFILMEDAGAASTRDIPQVSWFYLKENIWQAFSKKEVALDTTKGFLTSGVVALDLPLDICSENTIMGDDLFWLRVSTDENLKGPASLFTVQSNGLLVTLENPESRVSPMPSGSIKEAVEPLAGITGITQPLGSLGGRPPEAEKHRNIRMSERLKHKNRAVSPWDYEHLILEEFPEVDKAKCFPGISSKSWQCWNRRNARGNAGHWTCEDCGRFMSTGEPGHLLVSIIPRMEPLGEIPALDPKPRADAALLSRIQAYLQERSSTFASIEVRNPVYEKIQVRCKVGFKEGRSAWGTKQRLNRDIVRFISPWQSQGYGPEFGWRIRRSDLVSYIESLSYVKFVTRFSMLRISQNDEENYELFDTVTPGTDKLSQTEKQILPRVPWSLAINADHHFIQTTSKTGAVKPKPIGLNELEVGNTFIITG